MIFWGSVFYQTNNRYFNTSILGRKFSWNEKKQNLFIAKMRIEIRKTYPRKQCFK